MNPQMNTKSKLYLVDEGSIEILANESLSYKPYLLRAIRSNYDKLELRLSEEELSGLTDLFNSYLEDK